MKTITLKLTKLQQKILQHQLRENICSGNCFMHKETGHFPKYDCDSNCPKMRALGNIAAQLENTNKLSSLEIEKNRVVDIIRSKLVDFNKLNRAEHNWKEDGCSSPVEYYNEGIVYYCQLTEEEYNFLVNMVGIRDLDEEKLQ